MTMAHAVLFLALWISQFNADMEAKTEAAKARSAMQYQKNNVAFKRRAGEG
jgi:hypothetical protein